jgi:hypothetical protein
MALAGFEQGRAQQLQQWVAHETFLSQISKSGIRKPPDFLELARNTRTCVQQAGHRADNRLRGQCGVS